MSRFLPPPASPEHAFGIPATGNDNEFAGHPSTVIQDNIPRRMRFGHGTTEARVPTPFSRAYLFYFGLSRGFLLPEVAHQAQDQETPEKEELSQARKELLRRARGALRGICALFALREELHINIELRQAPNFFAEIAGNDGNGNDSIVYRMLARNVRHDPHNDFWKAPAYYVLHGSSKSTQVVAGLSPLTGFFPAAKKLDEIPSVYWYDRNEGWLDPGEPERREGKRVGTQLQSMVRRLLLAWVDEVLARLTVAPRPMNAALLQMGLKQRDIGHLVDEFRAWSADLMRQVGSDRASDDGKAGAVSLEEVPIPGSDAQGVLGVPFFNLVCVGGIPSDVPSVEGRLLVTTQELLNPHTRLHGPTFGNPAYRSRLATLPLEGENLGADLGLGNRAIPRPYLYLNRCFTPRLLQITSTGLSPEWTGLASKAAASDKGSGPAFLFPIDPRALKYLPLETLSEAVTLAETSQSGHSVTLRLGAAQATQAYGDPAQPEFTLDRLQSDRFDLRLFPNLRLDEVSETVLPSSSPDRAYFARLRLSPEWSSDQVPGDFLQVITVDGPLQPELIGDIGSFTDGSGDIPSSGVARFVRFRDTPRAIYLKDRGLCLVSLQRGPGVDERPAEWEVAIDFGTSNTCVAYRNRALGNPKVLKFPMLTTSVQHAPVYGRIRGTDEGQSARLDFFLYDPLNASLQELDFFPSQIVTRQKNTPQRNEEGSLRNGMIVFKNFSQMILEQALIGRLLTDFTPPESRRREKSSESEVKARFRIVQNIKWSDDTWMKVFMNNLRRHVVLAAAVENARVEKLVFSHPKSFSTPQVDNFDDVLTTTWQHAGQPSTPLKLISESEGVRNYIARKGYKDCVVFDIGGGTTDVLAFCGEMPFFQMSFKLAAGLIDRYVIASRALRQQLSDAAAATRGENAKAINLEQLGFHAPASLLDERQAPSEAMVQCQTVWHGLLTDANVAEDGMRRLARALASNYDRSTPDAQKAIRGFFLSLLVTFGGLAFLGGMMNRAMRMLRAQDGDGTVNAVELTFIGNGGKYYELLENRNNGHARFLEKMFAAGDGRERFAVKCVGVFESPEAKTYGGKQPKAAIALGMLLDAETAAEPPEVCNLLGENAFIIGDKEFPADARLEEFYREVPLENSRTGSLKLERSGDSAFDKFLAAIQQAAPAGQFGDSIAVPGLSQNWVKELIEPLQAAITSRTRARLQATARLWQAESGQARKREIALEPVFVAELASLLEEIREMHSEG